jgi:acetoin utilization protein AcuB
MLVSDAMTRHPIMISKETSAAEARRIMTENNIRHLPVAGGGKRLEGLVTRQSFSLEPEMVGSLDVWDISRFLSGLSVGNIMIKSGQVHTIGADKTIERAARTMSDHKVGSLPVIENGVVVGILTEVDVLKAIQDMLGMPEEGIRVTIRMPDRPGEFEKLTNVMGKNDMGVVGIGTFHSPRRDGYYDMVVKICNVSQDEVTAALGQIPDQEIIDIRTVV